MALLTYGTVKAFHPSLARIGFFTGLVLSVVLVGVGYYLLLVRSPRGRRQLAPAIVGLLGVLIGALTTSGIAYLGDRSRRNDDKRADNSSE